MTFGSHTGSHTSSNVSNNYVPPFARWPCAGDARTIGLHALAYPTSHASRAHPPYARLQPGAPFLPFSRGEHAGTY
ncbi:hypothetical protein PAP18089_05245 [Pandoraea apista]|uniref:Uncharacterized protein n=1 Tax=Pandoraea apista TaxID=93218 RepID=A0A5E5PCD3_9BURK|nr:hypothetical protein LMG16407_03174 [Pandoraea apista]VVG74232.1 hypothetical protein PAP18089_05245 [Pandoraea apista]